MKIKFNLDKTQYKEKPKGKEGLIRSSMCKESAIIEAEPQTLIDAIQHGQTWTPQAMTGTGGDTFREQSIIAADIDNDHCTAMLTPDGARAILRAWGLNPYFMYYTFSNTAEKPKYRIIFILDEAITDRATAERITHKLIGLFEATAPGSADTNAKDNARLFFGSTPGSVFYESGEIVNISAFERIPDFNRPLKTLDVEPKKEAPAARPTGNSYEDLQAQFEYDKNNFDLESYILQTTGSTLKVIGRAHFINPCPICGHNDDFVVTGHVYKDFGAGGGTSGTIIDYLMARENIDMAEAIDKFKFEIMGYDREEWRQAWLKSTGQSDGNAADLSEDLNSDYLSEFFERIQTRAFEPFKTGVSFFDYVTGGGILKQSLILLLAAPGTGKTTLAQQIAESIAQQKRKVLYIALEMTRDQMLSKIFSAKLSKTKTPMAPDQIMQGFNWNDEQRDAISRVYEDYKEHIFPYIKYICGVHELAQIMNVLKKTADKLTAQGEPAPVVFIDYLHLINIKGQKEVAEIIKESLLQLKNNYAAKYDSFVFAIGATNRNDAQKRDVTMYSGRDTSGIEFTGDYVITMNELENDNSEVSKKVTLKCEKSRLTASGKETEIYLHGESSYFSDRFTPGTIPNKYARS